MTRNEISALIQKMQDAQSSRKTSAAEDIAFLKRAKIVGPEGFFKVSHGSIKAKKSSTHSA